MDANQPSLRTQAVRGSIYLTLRQAFSVVLGVVGLLLMTRIVGPEGLRVIRCSVRNLQIPHLVCRKRRENVPATREVRHTY